MSRTSWLGDDANLSLLDDRVRSLTFFTDALADGHVVEAEVQAQEQRVIAAIQAVESSLNDAQHAGVTALLVEISAYNIMRTLHELELAHARRVFAD